MTVRRYVVILSDNKRFRECTWHAVEASNDMDVVNYARNWLAMVNSQELIARPYRLWHVFTYPTETTPGVLVAASA